MSDEYNFFSEFSDNTEDIHLDVDLGLGDDFEITPLPPVRKICPARLRIYSYFWQTNIIMENSGHWKYFLNMCEKHITKDENENHYNFWNIMAVCAYCTCVHKNIPVTIQEMIEVDNRITRSRMNRIGKTVMILEKVTHQISENMAVALICRISRETYGNSQSVELCEKEVLKMVKSANKKLVGVNANTRLLCAYMSLMPIIRENELQNDNLDKGCILLNEPSTMWLIDMCREWQRENIG